ncbi:hypothetical protein SK128_025720, partial [Halocaridina rubra]
MVLFAVNCFMNAIFAFLYFGQLFMTLTPPHWCRPPPDIYDLELTNEEVKQLTIPMDSTTGDYSKCRRYDVNVTQILMSNRDTVSNHSWNIVNCTYGWEYDFTIYYPTITSEVSLKGGLHGQTVRRTRFDRQVFEVMFERVNGVFGCRTRNVFDNQIPRSHVRTSLQTLVCRTAFDEPFDR